MINTRKQLDKKMLVIAADKINVSPKSCKSMSSCFLFNSNLTSWVFLVCFHLRFSFPKRFSMLLFALRGLWSYYSSSEEISFLIYFMKSKQMCRRLSSSNVVLWFWKRSIKQIHSTVKYLLMDFRKLQHKQN